MFIAMNRFKVLKDSTADFENVWFSRESYLHELPGFMSFHLLQRAGARGPRALFLAHHVAQLRRFRGLDQVGGVPQGARPRRQQPEADHARAIPSSKASTCCRR